MRACAFALYSCIVWSRIAGILRRGIVASVCFPNHHHLIYTHIYIYARAHRRGQSNHVFFSSHIIPLIAARFLRTSKSSSVNNVSRSLVAASRTSSSSMSGRIDWNAAIAPNGSAGKPCAESTGPQSSIKPGRIIVMKSITSVCVDFCVCDKERSKQRAMHTHTHLDNHQSCVVS